MEHSKLNWLRAGVLGANDGIISVAVLLVTLVGIVDVQHLVIVGVSTILGGAISMALGEYVSVAAQRDAEKQAESLNLTNPWHAAFSSFSAFAIGALFPFFFAVFTQNIVAVISSVYLALIVTTIVSVKVGKVKLSRPLIRNFVGGTIALGLGIILNIVLSGS